MQIYTHWRFCYDIIYSVMEVSGKWVRIGVVARALGLSPSRVRQLADEGVIASRRTAGGHRLFDQSAIREAQAMRRLPAATLRHPAVAPVWQQTIPLPGADESEAWQHVRTALALPDTAAATTMQYAFTELLNNAIDHSGASTATITWWIEPALWSFEITDQGDGVFPHLRSGLGLEDMFAAIQELTKGRTTTAPDRHTGEGIFFASKAVDVFALSSAGLTWTVDNLRADQAVGTSPVTLGTRATCEIDPVSDRSLAGVFARFTDDNFNFSRSNTVVHLFGLGVRFVSRSEAKRLLEGLDRFTQVEVDFTGVQDVGQGFVDELVRVWPSQHPGTTITPTHMNSAVEFMLRRGLRN
jgi:anti-sigma regulatory factor (Ser/Thr protein kinase)